MNLELIQHFVIPELSTTYIDTSALQRIEKKLILETKLSDDIDINDVERLLKVLRAYPNAIVAITKDYFLFHFIQKKKFNPQKIAYSLPQVHFTEIKACLSDILAEDIVLAAKHYITQNEYAAIVGLSIYKQLLEDECIFEIQNLLENRLENGIKILRSNQSLLQFKHQIICFHSRDFYVALSKFIDSNFNYHINQLIGVVADHYNAVKHIERQKFYLKVMCMMRYYKTDEQELKKVIHNNYDFAKDKSNTNLDLKETLLKKWWIWLIAVIWIWGYFSSDDNHSSQRKHRTQQQYVPTIEISALFTQMDQFAQAVIEGQIVRDDYKAMERNMNAFLKAMDGLDSSYFKKPMFDDRSVIIWNQTQHLNAYLLIDRDSNLLQSSIHKIPEKSSNRFLLHANEPFKLLINNNMEFFNKFRFIGMNDTRAKILEKTFILRSDDAVHDTIIIAEKGDSVYLKIPPHIRVK